MIIGIDEKKYRKKTRRLYMAAMAQFVLGTFILIMLVLKKGTIDLKGFVIVFFLFALGSLLAFFLKHFVKVGKQKDRAITYENGILNDFTKRGNRITDLKIEEIENIFHWQRQKKVNQYKISTKKVANASNEPANQLAGKDFYLTDYLVDSKQLRDLAIQIGNDVAKLKAKNG